MTPSLSDIVFLSQFPINLLAIPAAAWLAAIWATAKPRGIIAVGLGIVLIPAILCELVWTVMQALTFSGRCAAWDERGSHPCTFHQWMTLDWELGAVLSIFPLLGSIALAAMFWGIRRRRTQNEPKQEGRGSPAVLKERD